MNKSENLTIEETLSLAIQNHNENKFDIAADFYKKILEVDPKNIGALNNLGNVFEKLGENQKAIRCYEKVIEINPNHIDTLFNLGGIFQKLGEHQKTLNSYDKIRQIDPENILLLNNLTDLFSNIELSKIDNTYLKKFFLFLFRSKYIYHKVIADKVIKFLFDIENYDKIKTIFDSNFLLSNEIIDKFLNEELLHLILQKSLIVDIFLEKLLTKVKCEILFTFNNSNKKLLNKHFDFIISLAEQCWLNEYVYIDSEKENNEINKLKDTIENDKEINEIEIAIFACYRPLNKSKIIIEKLLDYKSSNILFNDLIDVQIKEPLKEIELKKSIKSLDKIVDPVSIKVQEQYEEHPYPRWRITRKTFAQYSFEIINQDIKPNFINQDNKPNNPNVLIAGCGTGNHSISATRYKNSNILAVDLSLSSLAYAKRKTEEMGYKNIEYMHADILHLNKLNKKFDVIESSGVLHHMKDPMAGLKVLVDILEPHGFLKLGLYSNTARQHIVKARESIKIKNLKNTNESIKKFRQDIIDKKVSSLTQKVTLTEDFYSTSAVRDLLFHIQEHRFTIPQISKILENFNLEFLGFIQNPSIKQKYSKYFPEDKKCTSLDNLHKFEEKNPDTFWSMYQFWVRKLH